MGNVTGQSTIQCPLVGSGLTTGDDFPNHSHLPINYRLNRSGHEIPAKQSSCLPATPDPDAATSELENLMQIANGSGS
jgi:hypothetical protein